MSSTADCKALLMTYSAKHGLNNQWKRVRKYKQGVFVLRDFINAQAEVLTIQEQINGELSIVDNTRANNASIQLPLCTLSKEKLQKELIRVCIALRQDCYPNVWENATGCTEEINALADNYLKTQEEQYLEKILNIFPDIDNIITHILYGMLWDNKKDFVLTQGNLLNDIAPQSVGVQYDFENIYSQFCEKDKVNILHVSIGGDWEVSVQMYFYWDEIAQRVVGVFPKGKPNTYNEKTKTAYGSEEESENYPDNGFSPIQMKRFEAQREKIETDMNKHEQAFIEFALKELQKRTI